MVILPSRLATCTEKVRPRLHEQMLRTIETSKSFVGAGGYIQKKASACVSKQEIIGADLNAGMEMEGR